MNRNTILITGGVIAVVFIGGFLSYYYTFALPKKSVYEECAEYVPDWSNFVSCHGVITITDAWDVNYLSIRDHLREYEIARVYSINQIHYSDGKLYVINRNTIEGQTSNGTKNTYYQRLFQDGKISINYYDSVLDIPTYLIIDTRSGEVKAYKNLSEIPKKEAEYFLKIE